MTGRKFHRNEPIYASYWMLNHILKDKSKIRNLNIKVYVRHLNEPDMGRCYQITPKSFVIVLASRLTRNHSLRVLAHECTHIAQYVSGRLSENRHGSHWKSKVYLESVEDEYKLSRNAYLSLPWEKEARNNESRLAKAYKKHLKSK